LANAAGCILRTPSFSVIVERAYVNLSDLYQLAEATQRLYLKLPPFYEDYGHD
jgi:hypothetical protein